MTFIPFHDKIEVIPIKEEGIIEKFGNNFQEAGTVVALGKWIQAHQEVGGDEDVAVGDTVFFLSHGCWETAEIEGVKHWVVPFTDEFILGIVKKDATSEQPV